MLNLILIAAFFGGLLLKHFLLLSETLWGLVWSWLGVLLWA